jgi:hypothetical protein
MLAGSVDDARPSEDEARARRVEVARRSHWVEIEEPSVLVRRGRSFLVHADTDAVYSPHRGVVFAPGAITVIADYNSSLHYFVRDDGELVFLERQPGTWSDRVARRAQHEARRRAAR